MDGYFIISVDNEETGENYDMHQINDKFHDEYYVDHHHLTVSPLENIGLVFLIIKVPTSGKVHLLYLTMEGRPAECDDDIVITELQLSANGNDLNLYAEFQDNNDCGAPIQMQLSLYKNDQYHDYFCTNNNYYVQDMGMTCFNDW